MNVKFSDLCYDDIQNPDVAFTSKMDIMSNLPIECQIDENSYDNTFKNLFRFFLNDKIISGLPEPFYSDYIEVFAERTFFRKKFNECLKEMSEIFA